MSDERWLPVVGYEGLYEVSDAGRVRSLGKTRSNGQYHGPKILASRKKESGHVRVDLHNGTSCTKAVHRLVLEAFRGPCPPGMEARHLNDVPDDNRPENLVWGTRSENVKDRVANGIHHVRNRTHCPRGHLLEAPNLRANSARGGRRGCLACNRAAGWCSWKGVPFSASLADVKYREIMKGLKNVTA